ncbi:MAG: Transcriptional regulator [Lactobacillus helveticus]|jgi:hypothetical protein|uniref:hypothetical protein n=1 Tax=Lactobacillus helveticus TaxID=1587 RepID=UPI0015620684|nr:hypothetical protein [Lactobacillus helveticus]NRN88264.1 hypothetical protein [Lactobacillus helveticus]NRO23238.1 hypothetical protein [Lactobacillus helveticus]
MDENRVINSLRALIDKRVYNLLFQPVTRYIKYFTVKFPKKLDIQQVVLSNDNYGNIMPDQESISFSLMGTMIDYLTRIVINKDLDAFDFLAFSPQAESIFSRTNHQKISDQIKQCKNI